MRKLMLAVIVLGMSMGVNLGCDKNKSHDHDTTSGDAMKMSTDDCAMCPGNQTADASGKCPKCGMKVKG